MDTATLTVADIETLMGYTEDRHKNHREIIESTWDTYSSRELK